MSAPLKIQRRLGLILRPISALYAKLMRWRRSYYRRKPSQAECWPLTISVGNISWGGTGKTPIIDFLLEHLYQRGKHCAVLTRGYKGKPDQLPLLVRADTLASVSGDEPLLLALAHPEAKIVVDPKRVRAAAWLMQTKPAPDILLLDDGFQHLAMPRSLDLVLLDPDQLWDDAGWNLTLPAGTWREGADALAAGTAFLIKTTPQHWQQLQPALTTKLAALGKPVFGFDLVPRQLIELNSGQTVEQEQIGPYALVCAVGNPASVQNTAAAWLGREPAQVFFYPDHYDFRGVASKLAELDLPIICTTKDAVKLRGLNLAKAYALEVKPRFHAALFTSQSFADWLDAML